MRRGCGLLWSVVLGIALGAPSTGAALSLAELGAGASLTTPAGVTLSDFDVKVAGKLPRDLSLYEVELDDEGFSVIVPGPARRGRLRIRYAASTEDPSGMLASRLQLEGSPESARGIGRRIAQGRKRIARLAVRPGPGVLEDEAPLLGVRSVRVRDVYRLRSTTQPLTVRSGFVSAVPASAPEPGTALLLGAGLAGLFAVGRRRRGPA